MTTLHNAIIWTDLELKPIQQKKKNTIFESFPFLQQTFPCSPLLNQIKNYNTFVFQFKVYLTVPKKDIKLVQRRS